MARDTEAELDKYINDLADIQEPDTGTDAGDTNDVSNDDDAGAVQQQQEQTTDTTADGQTGASDKQNKDARGDDGGRKQQKAGDKKGQQQQQGQKTPAQQQLRSNSDGTFSDGQGNIVDKDGKLIAQSGYVARMYHTARRMRSQLEERTQQLNELSSTVGELRSLNNSIRQYQLDNDEVAQALDLAGRMKRGDYLGVAKEVIALIAAQGYNVTDLLGSDVGDSIDMRAVRQMLDQRLAPIAQQEQQQRRNDEAAAQGRRNYERFVSENDYADIHGDAIVGVMRREQCTPQQAYNRLLMFATRNNLDFTQPLGPQIEQRQQQAQGGNRNGQHQQQQQQMNGQQRKPMPNGAGTRSPGAVPTVPLADAEADWGTIISEVQRTIGNA